MLRSAKDMRIEYENGEHLKRIRHSYITHIVDYVCQDRDRVFSNDKIAYEERHKDRVTVDNVFAKAKQMEENKKQNKGEVEEKSEDEEEVSEEEEYDDEEEGEEELEDQEKDQTHLIINQNDMLKSTSPEEVPKALGNDNRD